MLWSITALSHQLTLQLHIRPRRQAAQEAQARWRSGESSRNGKPVKPHRMALVKDANQNGSDFKEVDVKKFKVPSLFPSYAMPVSSL